MIYGQLRRQYKENVESCKLPDTILLQTPQTHDVRTRATHAAIVIGRHPRSNVRLLLSQDPERVSPVHANITLNAEGVHVLRDIDSLNGTYINDCLVPQTPGQELKHGDIVSFSGPRCTEYGINVGKPNPLIFEYRQPLNLDAWKREMLDAWKAHRPVKHNKRHREAADSPVPWIDDDVCCAICTEVFVDPYLFNGCGHTFCYTCITKWLSERSKCCPICRHEGGTKCLTPNLTVQTLLDRFVISRLTPEARDDRIKLARVARDEMSKSVVLRAPTVDVRPPPLRIWSPEAEVQTVQPPNTISRAELVARLLTQVSAAEVMAVFVRDWETDVTAQPISALFAHLLALKNAQPSVPLLCSWKAVSSEILVDTPCSVCLRIIPARFLRMRRTAVVAGVDVQLYTHVKRSCINRHIPEILRQVGVFNSEKLTDQERRVAKKVCAL
jgi:hypothetical protein